MSTGNLTLFEFMKVAAPAVHVHRDASDTEHAAARKVSRVAGRLRMQVLQWIEQSGDDGRTMKELGRMLATQRGKPLDDATCRYSAAPRVTELRDLGMVQDSNRRREGSIVWVRRQEDAANV